jgi:hypothetical protein
MSLCMCDRALAYACDDKECRERERESDKGDVKNNKR